MTTATAIEEAQSGQLLSLPEELMLILLNEESGYFRQIPGWDLNCAMTGAVLAELSLSDRLDTDMESLILLDSTPTGNKVLDGVLAQIAAETDSHNAQYWVERLAPQAEDMISETLDGLVEKQILDHHDGEFWTLSRAGWRSAAYESAEGTVLGTVNSRIARVIFDGELPEPRDAVIIGLANTCDVLRFIYPLEEEHDRRVDLVSRMDLIGQAIAEAVSGTMAGPALRRSTVLTKEIPTVPLTKLIRSPHRSSGNIPAIFADLVEEYGPVFRLKPPFQKEMIFLGGPETNNWAHRQGRLYLRAKDYLADFEKIYGAAGILPALDGADHFRFRKSMQPAYSRARLEGQLDSLYGHTREHIKDWQPGDEYQCNVMCREMVNAALSPLFLSVDSQDIIEDLIKFKERALLTHVVRVLPTFMLKTPSMRRRSQVVGKLLERVQSIHTPAQRAGKPRDLADDILSLHASDPSFLPESNLSFQLSAALIASVYMGDNVSFALYNMVTRPDLYARITAEADALFANGDPNGDDFTLDAIDTTHRFIMESMRVNPIVPMSLRAVMNSCVVEGYEIREGTELYIAQSASHYMEECFPNPYEFDIDRYKDPRNEHRSPGYAPYGLGTHTCLGSRWMELQLSITLLLLSHYFHIQAEPEDKPLKIDPFPSLSINKRHKFAIKEIRNPVPPRLSRQPHPAKPPQSPTCSGTRSAPPTSLRHSRLRLESRPIPSPRGRGLG